MWTIGQKNKFGTYNANMIYDENGNSILQVYGIASNFMLEELNDRDADGLAIARQVVNDHNTIAVLREAGEKMAEAIKPFDSVTDIEGQDEEQYLYDQFQTLTRADFHNLFSALEAWEAANK